MSDRGRAFVNIENVDASATLKQQIDLNAIVRVFPGVEYRPEQFPGLIYRMDEPKVVILLFASGKLVCTGAKKEIQVDVAVRKLQEILEAKQLITYDGTEKPQLPPMLMKPEDQD